jgi:hypothetical protein
MKPLTLVLLFSLTQFMTSAADASGTVRPAQLIADPSGNYEYVPLHQLPSDSAKPGKPASGYSGRVKVKLASPGKIDVDFYVNKGAPSYNSGEFISTLDYQGNVAIYEPHDEDPSCKIIFTFNATDVLIEEKTDDLNSGCGFGHAVVADGRYKKRPVHSKKRIH